MAGDVQQACSCWFAKVVVCWHGLWHVKAGMPLQVMVYLGLLVVPRLVRQEGRQTRHPTLPHCCPPAAGRNVTACLASHCTATPPSCLFLPQRRIQCHEKEVEAGDRVLGDLCSCLLTEAWTTAWFNTNSNLLPPQPLSQQHFSSS